MMKSMVKAAAALVVAIVVIVGAGGIAAAVDAPKWVAVVYIDSQKAVGLRWAPAAGATGYKVLRSTGAGKDYKEIASGPQPQYFDKTLEPGATYSYVLRSVAGAEVSALSDERSVAIPGERKVEAVQPPKMDSLTLDESEEFGKVTFRVGVFWNKSTSPGIVAYNLYRTTVPGKDYQLVSSSQDNKYRDMAVEDGKTYYYAVSALDNQFQETPLSPEMSIAVVKTVVKAAANVEKKKEQEIIPRPTKLLHELSLRDFPVDVELMPDGELAVAANSIYIFADPNDPDDVPKDISEGWSGFRGVGKTREGNLIAVSVSKGVRICDLKGKVLKEWIAADDVSDAYFVDADQAPDGMVYVTDNSHRILKLDENLKFLGVVNKDDPGFRITNPTHIQIAKDGTKYIDSFGRSAFYILDKDDKVIGIVGEIGQQVGTFGKIQGLSLDGAGNVWAADMQNGTVQVFNPKGEFLYLLTDETKKANIAVNLVSGISVSPDGKRLYTAFSLKKTIGVFEVLPLP